MTLHTIFAKPVDRKIEGVIKADDQNSLRLEVDEYVLTDEVAKRLETFLDAYNNYAGANGVWISGFFGSGKSHLLKILSMLLENHDFDDATILDLFLPKCGTNEFLRAELRRATAIPSRSILFNIDQKADVISKTEMDALVSVFVKVFDEMCGYYGKQGHVAQFERDLDSRGLYSGFKAAYEQLAGRTWERGREQALLEGRNIAQAYAKVTGEPDDAAKGILDKYRKDYRVSIEDFAEQVNAYVSQQGPDFRLNFFVDEVGQYIADNVKLMTNLQTIAESLATKCNGRAWVIVTAQEDMNSVVGEMGKQQSNDFSKIQARFANRMKLTSADVEEVIQKRLLEKNEKGRRLLKGLYAQQANNFKTLFDFADGSQNYRNFRDEEHFIQSYPFVPYQFILFQLAIQNLSSHNAFEGKHSSVGERSMLGVFQEVVVKISAHDPGQLATFDLMFEGVRNALKSNIQRAVQISERNLNNPLAIRLLKTLFLVKYVQEFKATTRNLCVLMLDEFDQDLPSLRKQIVEALALLEQQTYIQRNGEEYEYLTDEEKDVEEEIKATDVETSDVADELQKVIFDQVIKERKISYDVAGQNYPYTRKLDDKSHGREQELTIHVISPFYEHAENLEVLLGQSMGRDELLVIMPPDEQLMRDLLMYKRTEKYIRQNYSITQQESRRRILQGKGTQNDDRMKAIQSSVRKLLGQAGLYVGGNEIEIGGEDGQNRITKGFHELIARSYPNLQMLQGIRYTEDQVGRFLKQAAEGLFAADMLSLEEAEQEMLAAIQNNQRTGVRTTMSKLLETFERKPNGWPLAAILCMAAKLCARGKLEVRIDGTVQEDEALEQALRNSRNHGNVLLAPQIDFSQSQLRNLKAFYEDFFDRPAKAGEAKALGQETANAFQTLHQELAVFEAQKAQYPFLNKLTPVLETLTECSNQPYSWYLTELPAQEDSLLDLKEQLIGPIRNFMSGSRQTIFDEARSFLATQTHNLSYIESDGVEEIRAALADSECYKGNRIQQVKGLIDELQAKIDTKVEAEIAATKAEIEGLEQKLINTDDFAALTPEQQAELRREFPQIAAALERERSIPVLNESLRIFKENQFSQLLTKMTGWAAPAPAPTQAETASGGGQDGKAVAATNGTAPRAIREGQSDFVFLRSITVGFDKLWLADEDDVDAYLQSLRDELLAQIKNGNRIQL